MFRKQLPDLDMLESPLISANPFGSQLGSVPQSALVEQIFNDPFAWSGVGEEEPSPSVSSTIQDTKDAMTWLSDELEKYHASEDFPFSPIDDFQLRPFSERFKLVPTQPLSLDGIRWEGLPETETPSYLPIFRQSKRQDFNLHMSRYFDASALMSPAAPRTERPLSKSSIAPLNLPNIPPALDLTITSPLSPSPAPTASASASASVSATWSILEMYGVSPETPRHSARTSILSPYTSKNFLSVPSVPSLPKHLRSAPSTARDTKPKIHTTPARQVLQEIEPTQESSPDGTPVRKLPVVPASSRSSPTPPSPPPPLLKTPERKKESPVRRVRSAKTLPTFDSGSDVTPPPLPQRSCSVTRSPPIGPRPRSGVTTPKRRVSRETSATRERDESPFTISPAPRRTRRSPSPLPAPPPAMRVQVHC